MYDIIIKNGRIVDFDSNNLKVKDIGIKDGKVENISNSISNGKIEINAEGKIVSPGFIDIHMHEEVLGYTDDGDDYDIANKMLNMGVTTCIGGNCGNLRQPLNEFLSFVEKNGAPVNYMLYTGHNTFRDMLGISKYIGKQQRKKLLKWLK